MSRKLKSESVEHFIVELANEESLWNVVLIYTKIAAKGKPCFETMRNLK